MLVVDKGEEEDVSEVQYFAFLDAAGQYYTRFVEKLQRTFDIQDTIIMQLKTQDRSINLRRMANVFKSWHNSITYLGDIGTWIA